MEAEVLFLKYAFPCSFIIKQRGEINDIEFKMLESAAIYNKILPRKFLERVYFRAFQKIKKVADDLGRDIWDKEVIHEYFIKRHNSIIEDGMYAYAEAPDALKNLCKVHYAKVLKIEKDFLVVEYDYGKLRPVIKTLIPKVKKGDVETIHYGYACEK